MSNLDNYKYYGNDIGWATANGEYGSNAMVIFNPDLLTTKQWDNVGEMHENDRIVYIMAILSKKQDVIDELERNI